MPTFIARGIILCLCLLFFYTSFAQLRLSGTIQVKTKQVDVSEATVYIKELVKISKVNESGNYSFLIPKIGVYTISYSLIGHETLLKSISITQDTVINVVLEENEQDIDEVIVSSQAQNQLLRQSMGVEKLSIQKIKRIPSLMGEVDVLKVIQLLPGVQPVSEGTSAYSVRGGSPDQNLVLLDNATVYNPSHLMGFFSVFNNDIVRDITLYKGDFPPKYGGRLSSLLEVETKEFDGKNFTANGGIGLISSRLTLEGARLDGKFYSFISGRRTYADLFTFLSPDENIRSTVFHFYDLNAKVDFAINPKNRITLSGYFGRDKFAVDFASISFGNTTATLNWKSVFSEEIFNSLSATYTNYLYNLGTNKGTEIKWVAGISEATLQNHLTIIRSNHTIRLGVTGQFNYFEPGKFSLSSYGGVSSQNLAMENRRTMNFVAYGSHQIKFWDKLNVQYGLRYTFFANVGESKIVNIGEDYEVTGIHQYNKGDIYGIYNVLEPRVNALYQLSNVSSIKASYGRNAQLIHLLSASPSGSPLEIWLPSGPNIKPQISNQAAIGYFHNFFPATIGIETSAEIFYKRYTDLVDFKDHTQPTLNANIEADIRKGSGYSAGLELMLKKTVGKLSGWISYTFSRSFRTVETVNFDRRYSALSDRPHSINIILSYDITKYINFSANWIFVSGLPTTFPEGRMLVEGVSIPIYSDRNSYRFPDYHRLDLSTTIKLRNAKSKSRWYHDINISVYNAYMRKNPWFITFVPEGDDPDVQKAQMIYLFRFIPSITYNFSF